MKRNRMDIKATAKKLSEADRAYYSTGHPVMVDSEYDALKDSLRKEDPEHPLLSKIGSEPSSSWEKASHTIPMGSQNKVNTEEEFIKWASKFPDDTIYTAQPKLDGLSLSLIYEKSEFQCGITRGDGSVGEDITENVLKMKGLKLNLPGFSGAIRAEILLPKSSFEKINSILSDEDQYMNARNAASGISRRLDGRFCQYLTIMPYNVEPDEFFTHENFTTPLNEDQKIKLLWNLGLNAPMQAVGDKNTIPKAFKKLTEKRTEFPFEIDGMVIKVCSHLIQNKMGSASGRPKAQIAWKFEPPGAQTIFIKETWDVGRTGVVTPLAHIKPVEINGSIIRKATLHNVAEIKRLGIGLVIR